MIFIKQRKLNRLKNFDYSSSGYYFITICTKGREEYFGNIIGNKMILNKYGEIVKKCWFKIPEHFDNVELNEFIIMPNHIHGIIIIKYTNQPVGNDPCVVPINNNQVGHGGPTLQKYIDGVNKKQFPRFNKRIWQKSYYDHIIRTEYSLFQIRQYIIGNPSKWISDRNNLINTVIKITKTPS